MKNTFLTILVTLFALAVPAIAQDSPKVEASVGYSFLRASGDTVNGFTGTGAFNFLRASSGDLGAEFEFGGYFDSGARLFTYQVGPIYNFGQKTRFFGRALFGGAKAGSGGVYAPQVFAGTIGGGIKLPVSDSLHLRVGPDYQFFRNAGVTADAFKMTIGIGFGK